MKFGLIFTDLDNLVIDNYWRKFSTYNHFGWGNDHIQEYLSNKANMLKIASFNTPSISFTASSRRNKYYEIYNKKEMMAMDVEWAGSVDALTSLKENFNIYIISSRKEELKEDTKLNMDILGFPIEKIPIFYLPPNTSISNHRKEAFKKITHISPSGFIITNDPNIHLHKDSYSPIGFSSLFEVEYFRDCTPYVYGSWKLLEQAIGPIGKQALENHTVNSLPSSESKKIKLKPIDSKEMQKEASTQTMLEKVISRQLFLTSIGIIGGDYSSYIKIKGLREIIKKFVEDLKEIIRFIHQNKITELFWELEIRFKLNFDDIKEQISQNLSALNDFGDEELKSTFIYIALSKILEEFRNSTYQKVGIKEIEKEYKELFEKSLQSNKKVVEILRSIDKEQDPNLFLLYNISFVVWLAEIYEKKEIRTSLQANIEDLVGKIIAKFL